MTAGFPIARLSWTASSLSVCRDQRNVPRVGRPAHLSITYSIKLGDIAGNTITYTQYQTMQDMHVTNLGKELCQFSTNCGQISLGNFVFAEERLDAGHIIAIVDYDDK